MHKEIYTNRAPEPVGPYSQAIQFKDLVVVSGQIPIDPKTGLLSAGTISEQTFLIFNSIKTILSEAGVSLENILKVDIFLENMDDFELLNQAYGKIFNYSVKPARCVVEVARLPKGAKLEISCIAGVLS